MLLLSGCTKSNIVQPDCQPGGRAGFSTSITTLSWIWTSFDEVNEICLDENNYPMADSLDFTIDEDKALIDVTIW